MSTRADKVERFRALHNQSEPLLLPNAWDEGTAKLFAALGFDAIATTSGGHASTLGRLDGGVTLDEAIEHAHALSSVVDIPLNADFENGFADDPAAVADNVARVAAAGAAGCSIEDFARRDDDPIYEVEHAAARVAAAAEVAHGRDTPIVLTARAENFLHRKPDLADTIARLQAYQGAGADVLYAPGIHKADDIRAVVEAVDRPVNVLVFPGVPPVAELAVLGVKRISVGSAFSKVALAAVVDAARELQEHGTYSFWDQVGPASKIVTDAFSGA
jgi:2-methylisocitrate lyase-like PEP mutase family enzyme